MNIEIRQLTKSYGALPVLRGVSLDLSSGRTYCLMGASGSGKTTLLRILLGLEQADSGTIQGIKEHIFTAVFQENRLCESFTPLENIRLVTGKSLSPDTILKELIQLLPEESISRPVNTLSGGMKRRVAIARALLAPSDGILMDEPFTGLDENTKQTVIDYIKEHTKGKLLLIATHQEEDISLLGGSKLTLSK